MTIGVIPLSEPHPCDSARTVCPSNDESHTVNNHTYRSYAEGERGLALRAAFVGLYAGRNSSSRTLWQTSSQLLL